LLTCNYTGNKSPLAQGRGLKSATEEELEEAKKVAPRAGAWIEIEKLEIQKQIIESPLAQGRGLKSATEEELEEAKKVAPRAGAWIEIKHVTIKQLILPSPLAQGRGLKCRQCLSIRHYRSRPSRRGVD